MIIVDTNVISSVFLRSTERKRALAALEFDTDWRLPPLWRSEFLSTCRHGIRTAGMKVSRCVEAFDSAMLLFAHREWMPAPGRVLDLVATTSALTSYDAEFLALAEEFETRVVTQDKDFAKLGGKRVVLLEDYLRKKK